ncbi:phage tail protein [Hymenobacter sp. GOD-10R]|uniref:phage tail protein n=1 Tax=Hymenobacter sp. GOD-10R TaxID=3093922 RepID=UPI002D7894B6|nr:tail fiber protein [Hymenobacter sp. GOD-10R]WRQ30685.1 tail fiber protein [Hymenobacter sp. GOD-10R]
MDPFVGEIRIMPYMRRNPLGWLPCDGQLLPLQQNTALFALLGTRYGGNGSTTFALPNLNGRVIMGVDGSYPQGSVIGTENVLLTEPQLPPHTHQIGGPVPVSTAGGSTGSPAGAYFASTQDEAYGLAPSGSQMAPMATGTTGISGGNETHENRMPYLALGYYISLQGVFPPRP